jgi:hypothetical protein
MERVCVLNAIRKNDFSDLDRFDKILFSDQIELILEMLEHNPGK